MSHIVTIKTEVRDRAAVEAACRRLGLEQPTDRKVWQRGGEVAAIGIKPSGWWHSVTAVLSTGQLQFDSDYRGEQKGLDAFLQIYAIEAAKIEARKKGHVVTEQQLSDGSVKLVIQVGGAA